MRQSFTQNQQPLIEDDDFAVERPALTNFKLAILIISTFGLIAAIYAIRYSLSLLSSAIEHVTGSFAQSYMAGGGIILALFCVYVIAFGICWFIGSGKREQLKRDVVEKAIAKERALQAKQNL